MQIKTIALAASVAAFVFSTGLGVAAAGEKSWQALQGVQAKPMTAGDMNNVKGKLTLADFFKVAQSQSLTGGATVWGWSSSGETMNVSGSYTASPLHTFSVIFYAR